MDIYHRLHVGTRSGKHGMPAQPRAFFRGLWDRLARMAQCRCSLPSMRDEPSPGWCSSPPATPYAMPMAHPKSNRCTWRPTTCSMWESIAWAASKGYQIFDMGRTARDNPGLMEYKRKWGAAAEPLPYYYWPHVAGLASTSEASRKYQILTACWKRLPSARCIDPGRHTVQAPWIGR